MSVGLLFGSIDLIDTIDASYWFAVLGEDLELGEPQPVVETIQTLLQDGSKVVTSRHENREVAFRVEVCGSDLDALAEAEEALYLECSKPATTLTYWPADGYAAATVFDVWAARLTPAPNDLDEVMRVKRTYRLTLTCAPFGRSDAEITTVGVTSAASPVTTVINDCSSATGWTAYGVYGGTPGFTPTITGGAIELDVQVETTGGWVPPTLVYAPAAPVDMSSTPFFAVDWKTTGVTARGVPKVWVDGLEVAHLSTQAIPGSSYLRSLYQCPDVSVASFRIKMMPVGVSGTSMSGDYLVDQIVKTNQGPSSGTLRQKTTAQTVLGSARAPGRLALEHATSALGDVVVYTYPDLGDGYSPPLRPWLTASGAVTTDSSLVSGAWNRWSDTLGGATYTVPLRTLRPGPYLVVARLRQTSGTAGEEIRLVAGDAIGVVTFNALNTWQMQTVGVMTIGDHIEGTSFSEEIESGGFFVSSSDIASLDVDEAWLFYVGDDAHLSMASLGTGTPSASGSSNRLWIDTPTATRPYPAMWRGTLADRSDARSALDANTEWADHVFTPPATTVFTVTTKALDAVVSLTYSPHWHTHARQVA